MHNWIDILYQFWCYLYVLEQLITRITFDSSFYLFVIFSLDFYTRPTNAVRKAMKIFFGHNLKLIKWSRPHISSQNQRHSPKRYGRKAQQNKNRYSVRLWFRSENHSLYGIQYLNFHFLLVFFLLYFSIDTTKGNSLKKRMNSFSIPFDKWIQKWKMSTKIWFFSTFFYSEKMISFFRPKIEFHFSDFMKIVLNESKIFILF